MKYRGKRRTSYWYEPIRHLLFFELDQHSCFFHN